MFDYSQALESGLLVVNHPLSRRTGLMVKPVSCPAQFWEETRGNQVRTEAMQGKRREKHMSSMGWCREERRSRDR